MSKAGRQKGGGVFDTIFAAFIVASPLLVYGYEVLGVSVRLSRLALVVMIPVLAVRVLRQPNLVLRDRFFVLAMTPFLVYSSLSVSWTSGTEGVWPRLGALWEIYVIYAIMLTANLRPDRFVRFVKYYVISAVIPVMVSVWQLANNIFEFSTAELPFQEFLIENKYEVLEHRYFFAGEGFSRISATFAEPVIFSNYLCSVVLLSLTLSGTSTAQRLLLTLFRVLAVAIIVLSVSKLAIMSLVIASVALALMSKQFRMLPIYVLAFGLCAFGVITYYDWGAIFERLFLESGHLELLEESLGRVATINYVFGEGIGSVEAGSTHRYILSRLYEAGVVGVLFAIATTVLPVAIYRLRLETERLRNTKAVCFGLMLVVVFGLNVYDYFIHLFPWISIGAVMSFYNAHKHELALRQFRPTQGRGAEVSATWGVSLGVRRRT